MSENSSKSSKWLVGVLITLLGFVAGWKLSSMTSQATMRHIADQEIAIQVNSQLSSINQKLDDMQSELDQIAQYQVREKSYEPKN